MVNYMVNKKESARQRGNGVKMARHGENIRKRTDGRWEGRYKVFCEEKGKYIYRSLYGHTYNEVKEKLEVQKNSAIPVGNTQKCGISFSETAKEWLQKVSEDRKHSTFIKYASIYENHLAGILGPFAVTEINDACMPSRIFDHLSSSQQKSIYGVANQILHYAGKHYHITVSRLTPAAGKNGKKPVEILTRAEQSKLLDCLYSQTDKYKTAVILCLYTGLRLGELCALKWENIDTREMTISVKATAQRIRVDNENTKTILMETEPKSDTSNREIPIPHSVLRLLARLQDGKPYIFGGEKSLEPRTMQYQFKNILREAGIADKNFHILRHTFATNCVESGADVKSLCEILGHSDVKITLNRYVHPTMDSKRSQIDSLHRIYGSICGQAV